MQKKVLFVFKGDPMCFIHVLLNALDSADKNFEARIVIEGEASKLIPELGKPDNALYGIWKKQKPAIWLMEFAGRVPRKWERWRLRRNKG